MVVLVVWERVGSTRVAPAATRPPPSSMLARVPDPRAAQFWDPEQLTAGAIEEATRRTPGWPTGAFNRSAGVLWDMVFVFPPGARWEREPPLPSYAGGNVVDVMAEVAKRI